MEWVLIFRNVKPYSFKYSKAKNMCCGRSPRIFSIYLRRVSNNKVKLQVHLLQCLKGIDLKVLGLNGLKRKVRLEK